MLLATWNCFQIPYSIAFTDGRSSNTYINVFNWIIDISFIIDLVLGFRTSYVNEKTGQEIVQGTKIVTQYVKGRFWIDLLATMPFDLIADMIFQGHTDSTSFQLFGLLKLARVLRLSKLIAYMNLKDDMKMSLKLIKLVFFLIMYLHCVACIWYFIVKQEQYWIPPLDEIRENTEIYQESNFYKYMTSLYYSVLTLAGNDMFPQDSLQIAFATILVLAGAIINANIFGNIAVLLQQLNRKAAAFQAKLENANSAMKSLAINDGLQKEIQLYLMSTQDSLDLQEELTLFLKMLSPSLKLKVTEHIFEEALYCNPIFTGQDQAIELFIKSMSLLLFYPEQEIFKQGDIGDKLYFIARGECDVFINDEFGTSVYTRTLIRSDYFGEISILKGKK